jgi:hypothetical protein
VGTRKKDRKLGTWKYPWGKYLKVAIFYGKSEYGNILGKYCMDVWNNWGEWG